MRYVDWYNQMVGRMPNTDPNAREHHEPWPGGRTNHYYFDLNRDWAWATQLETRQRLSLYNQWMPQVHVDFHEQGVNEPYYFAPAAEPFHEDITQWQRDFQTTIGKNHMRYFDANGWLYFTRQVFDLFYPAYGDTWPIFNGAVGMTYEQGGGGRAGLGIINAVGDTLTLADRIDHHYTTGLSTVEVTARNHDRVLSEFKAYFNRARTHPPGSYRAYLIKGTNEPDRLDDLTELLRRQGIEFGYADRARTVHGFDYDAGTTGQVKVAPGDLVISAYQPKSVLAKVLFEPRGVLADSLTYDVTAWALPYVYGVEAFAVTDRLDPDTLTPPTKPTPALSIDKPYAYLLEWKSPRDAAFLANVLQKGVRVRFSGKPFEIHGRTFGRGTLILTRSDNVALGDRFDQFTREAAGHQPLYTAATGNVARGPDFGSDDVLFLKKPRVAVLIGDGVSFYAAGEVWHFFDRQIRYPATLIDTGDFAGLDLHSYDVLILPNGSYRRMLTDDRLGTLKKWVQSGGRLIAMGGSISSLVGKKGFHIKRVANVEEKDKDDEDIEDEIPAEHYDERERQAVSDEVPGAIYRVRLDPTHPLAFGYPSVYYTLKRNETDYAFFTDKNDWNVGTVGKDGHVSGFAGYRAKKKLHDTLVFGVQRMGRGRVVYLVDDPLFRAFWYNGRLLLANAVFMTGQ